MHMTEPQARIPGVAYLFTACVAVVGCNSLVLGPIASDLALDFGTSVPGVMTAASAFGLGTAASALLLARYIDRIGARRMLLWSLLLLAATLAASAAAPFLWMLVVAQLAAGIAAGIVLPAAYGSAAAVAPAGRESAVIGIVLIGWTLSMVAGVSLSAVLADLVQWRAVYAAISVLVVLVLVGVAKSGFEDKRSPGPAPSPWRHCSCRG